MVPTPAQGASVIGTGYGGIVAASILALTFAFAGGAPADAEPMHVILCGSGGEEEFTKRFTDWGVRLRGVLTKKIQVPDARVKMLMEAPPEGRNDIGKITLEKIEVLFTKLPEKIGENDDLYVYFLGHGSYLRRSSKFHIPGPDLTAARFNELLSEIPARRIVVLNSTASSAGFINELSGDRRIICSATKSVDEINATEFMEHFITGLEEGSADRNHDDRISFLEACEQAAQLTAAWYTNEGLVATEHAILDDNGDGLGSRLPMADVALAAETGEDAPVFDGLLASQTFIQDFTFPADVPEEWVTAYISTMDKIEALKRAKPDMEEGEYYAELEALLVEAALTNRRIRGFAKPLKEEP